MGIKYNYFSFIGLLAVSLQALAASPVSIKIKCLENGRIIGGDDSNTCKNALPQCSDLRDAYQKQVRQMLSLKIYGYYKNKNVDLNQTSNDRVVGTDMPVKICSVVGHKIVYDGRKDLEFKEARNNGGMVVSNGGVQTFTNESCGAQPNMRMNTGDRRVDLSFDGARGARWTAVTLGAMPWELRAAEYRFEKGAQNVVDMDGLLNADAVQPYKKEYNGAISAMESAYSKFPDESKKTCSSPDYADVIARCHGDAGAAPIKVTDPAYRMCGLVKSQMDLGQGAIASMVLMQVVSDAQKSFDSHFAKLLKNDGDDWNALKSTCLDGTGWWSAGGRKRKAAKVASCLHDGDWMYTWNGDNIEEDDGSSNCWGGRRCRKDLRSVGIRLDHDDVQATEAARPSNSAPYLRSGAPITLANGYEGLVEYIIRHRICGQNSVTTVSAACDDKVIPDKPPGVKW
jgi:hypothetical protein